MASSETLTESEILSFLSELDRDRDGCISYDELQHKLDEVSRELQPEPLKHHLTAPGRDEQRHEFLRRLMGTDKNSIPTSEFKGIVASWQIPSLAQEQARQAEDAAYMSRISWARRLRAQWEIHGPEYVFLAFVIGSQIGLGVWQGVKYATGEQYQAVLGWGVGLSKTCAGALYPTMFFLILSMCRWQSTYLRRYYYVSRFVNWDRSHSFHIKMSIVALTLSTLHTIGHLGGTFVFGSRENRQAAVAALWGPDAAPKTYMDYVHSLPGWSGLAAFSMFWVLALLSIPWVKKHSYEAFQLGHLLMFPMIALLMAHGTAALLQYPVFGFVLAIPTLLVIIERSNRVFSGFAKIPAELEVLDADTVCITCTMPERRHWKYEAGQYVFLQVPQLSFLQWHPFTISTCIGREMKLHIKTDGDWTNKLHDMTDLKYVGIDGPFGAPAQRFYDFDQSIVVGAGIGITPFSGILNDLQTREDYGWTSTSNPISKDGDDKSSNDILSQEKTQPLPTAMKHTPTEVSLCGHTEIDLNISRRVDFHWIVRDKTYLLWFSDLLNRIDSGDHNPMLDIRIHNHITRKRQNISTHIFRWLLEKHRTPSQPESPLTGLIAPSHFGRPNLPVIMNQHYDDMLEQFSRDRKLKRKVGVFYCGAPVVGYQLADLCRQLTLRGREDGSKIEYHFQIEVFT